MPIVELRFPNVLQTSVQIGDYAYFSNPIAVGPQREYPRGEPGVPAGKTHTPHMTNTQSEIIMIGEIVDIGQWIYNDNLSIRSHDTFAGRPPVQDAGFIHCDMPQDLFNQYWDQIRSSQCETIPDPSATVITGDCANYIHAINHPVINNDMTAAWLWGGNTAHYNGYLPPENPFVWFFDNPTVDSSEVLFHITNDPTIVAPYIQDACEVQPNTKDVNGVDDFAQGLVNVWQSAGWFQLSLVNATGPALNLTFQFPTSPGIITPVGHTSYGNAQHFYPTNFNGQGNPGNASANDIISKMIELYPNGGYDYGMTYQEFIDHHGSYMQSFLNSIYGNNNIPFHFDLHAYFGGWPTGSYTPGFTTNCEEPSFIMFSKDNKANMSSLLGYYASVEFRNNSTDKAELFNVGTVFTESSK